MASNPSTASPPPPPYQPLPPPAPAPYAPSSGPKPVSWPRWLDYGMIVIGIGALLMLIGFLFGDGFAGQFINGSATTAQGDLEAFFVVTGIGVFLVVGGWLYRVAIAAGAKFR